jgi:hypothetical protein
MSNSSKLSFARVVGARAVAVLLLVNAVLPRSSTARPRPGKIVLGGGREPRRRGALSIYWPVF